MDEDWSRLMSFQSLFRRAEDVTEVDPRYMYWYRRHTHPRILRPLPTGVSAPTYMVIMPWFDFGLGFRSEFDTGS